MEGKREWRLAAANKALKPYGLTVTKTEYGEYHVELGLMEYFGPDLEDAVQTALRMADATPEQADALLKALTERRLPGSVSENWRAKVGDPMPPVARRYYRDDMGRRIELSEAELAQYVWQSTGWFPTRSSQATGIVSYSRMGYRKDLMAVERMEAEK